MKTNLKQISSKPSSWFAKAVSFLREVKLQLKKVTWPTLKEVFRYTVIVIVFSVLVGAFLGGLDAGFGFLINKLIMG